MVFVGPVAFFGRGCATQKHGVRADRATEVERFTALYFPTANAIHLNWLPTEIREVGMGTEEFRLCITKLQSRIPIACLRIVTSQAVPDCLRGIPAQ